MSIIYRLIPLINLDKNIQLKVLRIRNEEYIRKWMFTENEINEEEHFKWIEKLIDDNKQFHLIIIGEKDQAFGAVNLKNIDRKNKIAEIGFYKTQNINEKGLMTKSLSAVINYSFNILCMEKIYSEVIEDNEKSIKIHKKLLFVNEGFLRSHKIINEKRIGVYLFGLLKDEWEKNKKKINIRSDLIVEIENV